MRFLRQLRRGLAFARAYDHAYRALLAMSDGELARLGIARTEVWRAADRLAREAAGA